MKKKIEENPKRCHKVLLEELWVHRISKHSDTKITHFELVDGQEAVLPIEINLDALQLNKMSYQL
jgi:hypothetical protein